MAKSLNTYKFSLTKELGTVLAIKAVLLFLLWYFFFSPQHKTHVDEKNMGDILVSNNYSTKSNLLQKPVDEE